jgi:hypothetical protein
MTEPLRTRYVPGYDLFKLIVAVILTVILFLLMLRDKRGGAGEFEPTAAPTFANTPTPQATPSFTETRMPESTGTDSPPTTTSTPTVTATRTAEPPPTESPTPVIPSVTPTPEPSPTPDPNACPSNPTQIQVGDTVKVLDWLNFRVGPGLNYPIQHTNRPGAEMEVIGGPVCTIKDENPPRAYLWWNVRMGNGKEGWSAEAPLNFPNYFMEPVR